jgi:hypothetical protein
MAYQTEVWDYNYHGKCGDYGVVGNPMALLSELFSNQPTEVSHQGGADNHAGRGNFSYHHPNSVAFLVDS